MNLQGAVFDADGTLLDTMPYWYDIGAKYLEQNGIQAPPLLWRKFMNLSLSGSAKYLHDHFPLDQPVQEVEAGILQLVDDIYKKDCGMKPGARAFLSELHRMGVPMVLATANDSTLACAALDRLGVMDWFEDAISCDMFGTTKQEPFIYEEAARRVGLTAADTAVFEDILMAVRTAHEDGFYTVAMEDEASEKERPAIRRTADRYITDFAQLNAAQLFTPRASL